jgi:catecholate siderophore receptor
MRTDFKVKKLRLAIANITGNKATSTTLSTALLLSAMPFNAMAAETTELELESIEVIEQRISDTTPVKGYKAEQTSSATKTNTQLVNVPQSITVITKDLVRDQSVQSISEAVRYVPGVTASQGEGNRDALVFRGNRTTSDLYFDGMRDDIQTFRDLYNTDRIEVLKGANGMIFGRGGAGGVINRVSKKAGWDPIRDITASYGAYNQKRIALDVGQGINDVAAFRINTVYEDSDSYRDGVNIKRYGVTPTFTIAPDENTTIHLSMEYFKDERISDRGVPSINGAGDSQLKNRPYDLGDYSQFFGNAQLSPTETETVAFNASIEHAFSNGVNLKNSTRYANYDKFYQNIYARTSVNNAGNLTLRGYRDETKRENLINQTDITIPFSTGFIGHELLLGNEINFQDTENNRKTPTGLGIVSVNNPIGVPTSAFDTPNRDQTSDVSTYAFYIQDQIKLSPKWQAVVGVRHDSIEVDYRNLISNTDISVDDNFVSPRAGLIFKPTAQTSIYGNYSVAYAPRAGDQLISLNTNNANFKPEKFVNKEIGAKWDITPTLSFTAAVYQLERENVLTNDPNIAGVQILIDGQETKGAELSINGHITDHWQMFGGYSYQDGEITKDQGAISAGADLGETPSHTFSLWNKYQINAMWSVALGVTGRSEMYVATPTATTSTVLAGYTRYDAAIFATLSKQLSLQLNIENLTNKEYAIAAHNNNNITPGAPLTGRATLIYKF